MTNTENIDRIKVGTSVLINHEAPLVKEFPSLKGAVGVVALSFSEPCGYTGKPLVMYSVKMPPSVFGGRTVQVLHEELEVA